ncbi:lasso peptide biosynthesis B2 protein [Sphingomonas sp. AR_OL41]|uniref:lasso peptide biosynthesis B2 protein n=1 Tax=Sphingomonas sp. AR_OL41 TaxID=3042729 RepID=UPI00248018F0|nr:lasso peptide biosynthesis B2 protein [Sphingomonas sp. AR_OL41]MDH7970556.1 lasso peptide biosynthesis B2 protein [Sphingomonas sp. AR_OL41]
MSLRLRRRWKMWRHRVNRSRQVGHRERLLLAEAIWNLAAARFQLATQPFPQIARRLGGFVTPGHARASVKPAGPDEEAIAAMVGWAVTRAARHVPFKAVCLPQAMAAKAMLARRGIASVIHFGTRRGEALTLAAHAWVDAAGVEVTGYPVEDKFTEIACIA